VAEPEPHADKFAVKISSAAHRDLRKLVKKISPEQRKRIGKKIKNLAKNPRPVGSEKISNNDNEYRLRDGNYRILYEINDSDRIVRVGCIRDRSDVYRKR
jgi:mRNA interferase RelE/StbE